MLSVLLTKIFKAITLQNLLHDSHWINVLLISPFLQSKNNNIILSPFFFQLVSSAKYNLLFLFPFSYCLIILFKIWNPLQYHTITCSTIQSQYHTITCSTLQSLAVPYNHVWYHTIQSLAVAYHTITCSTILISSNINPNSFFSPLHHSFNYGFQVVLSHFAVPFLTFHLFQY